MNQRRTHPIYERSWAAYRECRDGWLFRFQLGLYEDHAELIEGPATHIYAVLDEAADAVKIGVGRDPRSRMSGLQIGNPNPLLLYAFCPGTQNLERAFHSALAPWSIRGEWFRASTEVLAAIDLIAAGEDVRGDIDLLFTEEEEGPMNCTDTLAVMAGFLFDAAHRVKHGIEVAA